MDIKDWQKLTPEQQRSRWENALELYRIQGEQKLGGHLLGDITVDLSYPPPSISVGGVPSEEDDKVNLAIRKLRMAGHPALVRSEMPEAPHGFYVCCDLRDWFLDQLSDELKAAVDYNNAAKRLEDLDYSGMAKTLRNMADQEYLHYLTNVGIAELLTKDCDCPRKEE